MLMVHTWIPACAGMAPVTIPRYAVIPAQAGIQVNASGNVQRNSLYLLNTLIIRYWKDDH